MAFWQIFSWWYGSGFAWAFGQIKKSLDAIGQTLAVSVLLRTLFAPWKQITSDNYRVGIFQKLIDNGVSRFIGFLVRFFMLVFGGLWALAVIILGLIWLIIWPIVPLSPIILLYLALKGVTL